MKLFGLNLGGAEKRIVAPADFGTLKHQSIVRKFNRKQAFLRLEERLLPWAIASCFVALVAFFQWLDWPTGSTVLH